MERCVYCDSVLTGEETERVCKKCHDILEKAKENKEVYMLNKFAYEEEPQIFKVNIDGEIKDAEVLTVLNIDGKKVALYYVGDGENVDIFASYVVTDEAGIDHLEEIEDDEIRKSINEYVEEALKEQNFETL